MAAPLTRVGSPALTREELVNILTMPLAAKNIVLNSGVRIFDAPTAVPLKIPKLSSYSASGWYAEAETISDSEAPTEFLTLLPSNLKSLKTWLPMSSEVIRNSPLALDAAMRDNLVFSVSRELEKALLGVSDPALDANGNRLPSGILRWIPANEVQTVTITGSPTGGTFTLSFGGQTTGNLNYNTTSTAVATALTGLTSIGANNVAVTGSAGGPWTVTFQGAMAAHPQALLTASGAGLTGGTTPGVTVAETTLGVEGAQQIDKAAAVPTLDDIAQMITLLESAFATPRVIWMTPTLWNHYRTIKDGYSRFQLQPNPTMGAEKSLFGIPVAITPYLASTTANQSSVILCDTDLIAVGRDNAPEARIFTETLAKQDEIALRVTARYDIGPIWAAGTCVMKNCAES